jgi:hypothetical protein
MANAKTEAMISKMVAHACKGFEIIPMFFQPLNGASNTVSAAVRLAKVRGLLVESGLDGSGKPKYHAPVKVATHNAPARVQ